MKNLLILGSGRSGTSMVAGTLAKSGYFMGNRLSEERESNPGGNFEDIEINRINEELLAQVAPKRPNFLGNLLFRDRPVLWQRWLSRIPVGTEIPCPPSISQQIAALTQKSPYCFKDPRFSYTLPVWEPFLQNTVFVCIFREPASTALSMLNLSRKAKYLSNLSITFEQAVEVWYLMYKHILDIHSHRGNWLFMHYNQALSKDGLAKLAAFTEATVDYSYPDPSISQSSSSHSTSLAAQQTYQQLCQLADYEGF